MCNRMIYPTICREMAKSAGKPDGFDPPPEETLGAIFNARPDGFYEFCILLMDLDIGTGKEIRRETAIAELKTMIMRSSDRHIAAAKGITPEEAAAIRRRYSEITRNAHTI